MSCFGRVIALVLTLFACISPVLAEGIADKYERYTTPPDPRQWKLGRDGNGGFSARPTVKVAKEAAGEMVFNCTLGGVEANSNGKKRCDPVKAASNMFGDYLKLEAGAELNYWQPSMNGFSIVNYETMGFQGYNFSAAMGLLRGAPILTVSYHAPFDGASRQRELMRAGNESSAMGMEQFKAALNFTQYIGKGVDAFIDKDKYKLSSYFLKTLGSFKPEYKFQSFFGEATAKDAIAIVGAGATRQGNVLNSGVTALNPGQTLSFRTTFETVRASIDVLAGAYSKDNHNGNLSVRLGYFDTKYRRPTVNGHPGVNYFTCGTCGAGSRYLLFDTAFRSRGFGMDADFRGEGADWSGNFGVGLDIGIDNSVKVAASSIDLYPKGISYIGTNLRAGLNYTYFRFGTVVSAFVGFDVEVASHAWTTGSSAAGKLYGDSDTNERISIKTGIRF